MKKTCKFTNQRRKNEEKERRSGRNEIGMLSIPLLFIEPTGWSDRKVRLQRHQPLNNDGCESNEKKSRVTSFFFFFFSFEISSKSKCNPQANGRRALGSHSWSQMSTISPEKTNMFLFEVIGKVVSGVGLHGNTDSLLVVIVPGCWLVNNRHD